MLATTKRKKAKAPKKKSTPKADFKALVSSLRGSMSWLDITVDEYLREKYAETDAENGR